MNFDNVQKDQNICINVVLPLLRNIVKPFVFIEKFTFISEMDKHCLVDIQISNNAHDFFPFS